MPESEAASAHPVGRVEFGVVNYNGGDALLGCVRSILSQEGPECAVRVFDNASGDGSVAALEAAYPEVEVIRSERNVGYPAALNRLQARMDAPVVVLSNMDLEFEPGWASAVVAALESDPDVGAVSTLVLEATDPPVVNSVGVRFFGDLHAQNAGSGEPYRPEAVARARQGAFGAYGAVMAFRRDAVAGLEFDEDYFLFFEETDFFLRFHLLGGRTGFVEGAVARHQRSLSTRRYSPLKLYYGERNRLTTVFKLLPAWYWPISAVHTVRRLVALARGVKALPDREVDAAGAAGADGDGPPPQMPPAGLIIRTLLRAWGAALIRLPRTLRKRRAFWARAEARPRDALALIRFYGLPSSELRLR